MTPAGVLERYAAAARAKDVDAFLALYADEVRTFDLWERWSYDGLAELRPMVEEWFGSLGDELVAVEFDEVREQTGDELAFVSAFTTFRGLSAEGEELRSMNNRLTWVLRKDGADEWKIVHEHTSAPVGAEGKVSLRRPS
jgi:ketosteroid isomerase-like protein